MATFDRIADLVALDARLKKIRAEVAAAVTAHGSHLMDLFGIGPAGAARILSDVGDVLGSTTPTSCSASSYATHSPPKARAREDTAGRLKDPARPTHTRSSTLRISHFPDPRKRRYAAFRPP